MTNEEKDFWRQIAGSLTRRALTYIGGLLLAFGWITEDQAQGFSTLEVALYVSGLIISVAPFVWSWLKIKFNVRAIRIARDDKEGATIKEITRQTRKEKPFALPV